jgi:hypothetical protein
VQEKKIDDSWDGNVPANYRTEDNPPKSLGRWVNRQRSAYAKGKLKQEFVDKLERVGLKWAVHEKKIMIGGNGLKGSSDVEDLSEDEQQQQQQQIIKNAVIVKRGISPPPPTNLIHHVNGIHGNVKPFTLVTNSAPPLVTSSTTSTASSVPPPMFSPTENVEVSLHLNSFRIQPNTSSHPQDTTSKPANQISSTIDSVKIQ